MVRALIFVFLLILLVIVAAVFSWLNPGLVKLDLAFAEIEIATSQAFVAALIIGWLFGLLSAVAVIAKLVNERRKLRKSVRLAETELANLRSLPMKDAG